MRRRTNAATSAHQPLLHHSMRTIGRTTTSRSDVGSSGVPPEQPPSPLVNTIPQRTCPSPFCSDHRSGPPEPARRSVPPLTRGMIPTDTEPNSHALSSTRSPAARRFTLRHASNPVGSSTSPVLETLSSASWGFANHGQRALANPISKPPRTRESFRYPKLVTVAPGRHGPRDFVPAVRTGQVQPRVFTPSAHSGRPRRPQLQSLAQNTAAKNDRRGRIPRRRRTETGLQSLSLLLLQAPASTISSHAPIGPDQHLPVLVAGPTAACCSNPQPHHPSAACQLDRAQPLTPVHPRLPPTTRRGQPVCRPETKPTHPPRIGRHAACGPRLTSDRSQRPWFAPCRVPVMAINFAPGSHEPPCARAWDRQGPHENHEDRCRVSGGS